MAKPPECIDCRLYNGLCPAHASELLREAKAKYKESMICGVCGASAVGGFCKECGAKKECPSCHTHRNTKDPYCPKCGTRYQPPRPGEEERKQILPRKSIAFAKFCIECGKAGGNGAFCVFCGTAFLVTKVAPKVLSCPKCKADNNPHDCAFCLNCGYLISARRSTSRKLTVINNQVLRTYCIKCGGPTTKGGFCIYCGKKYQQEQIKDQFVPYGEKVPSRFQKKGDKQVYSSPKGDLHEISEEKRDRTESHSYRDRTASTESQSQARPGKVKTFGERLREQQQQQRGRTDSNSSTLAMGLGLDMPTPKSTKEPPVNSPRPFQSGSKKKEVFVPNQEVHLSAEALKKWNDIWEKLTPEEKEAQLAKDVGSVLSDKSQPLVKGGASGTDPAKFIKDSGGGDMTASHLRTLQQLGKQANNIQELATYVRDLQNKYESQKSKERKIVETVLNDPYTRGCLFLPPSSNSPASTPRDSPRSDAPLLSGGGYFKTSFSPKYIKSLPSLNSSHIDQLLAIEESSTGVIGLVSDLQAGERKFVSGDEFVAQCKSLSVKKRQQTLQYLNQPTCRLFRGKKKFFESDINKLYKEGGAGSETLTHLKEIEASGQQFDTIEALISALQSAKRIRMNKLMTFFRADESKNSLSQPLSSSSPFATVSNKTTQKKKKPREEKEKKALQQFLKDEVDVQEMMGEEYIEDLLSEGETLGETMDLVSELKETGVRIEEIPKTDIPQAFMAARVKKLATLKNIKAVMSDNQWKNRVNGVKTEILTLDEVDRLYKDGRRGALTPQILQALAEKGESFRSLEEVTTALRSYQADDEKSALAVSVDDDGKHGIQKVPPVRQPPKQPTVAEGRRYVSDAEVKKLREYLYKNHFMTQQQAEGVLEDVLMDILAESTSLEEACACCKELHVQGVRLERLKSGEQTNRNRIKTTFRKMRKTGGPDEDVGDIVYMKPESIGGGCSCLIL